MNKENLIPIHQLCSSYELEMSFFSRLNEFGMIEINTINETHYINEDCLSDIEKMIRLVEELDLNMESIDVVLNLLNKIEDLQLELHSVKNRLNQYEN